MMDNVQMIRGQAAQIQMEKKPFPAMSRLSPLWSALAVPPAPLPQSWWGLTQTLHPLTAAELHQAPCLRHRIPPGPAHRTLLWCKGTAWAALPRALPVSCPAPGGGLGARRMMRGSESGQGQLKGAPCCHVWGWRGNC